MKNFNNRLDGVSLLSTNCESEELPSSFTVKLRRFFFAVLSFALLFFLSLVVMWYASTESQRVQTSLFVQQAFLGNVDFSILQQTKFQSLGGFDLPWKEESKGMKELFVTERNNIPPGIVFPGKVYLLQRKYENLYSCGKRSKKDDDKEIYYKWKDGNGQVHLSDLFPTEKDYYDLKIRNLNSESFFSLMLDRRYSKLPPFVSDRMKRDVNQIYKILTANVGISQLNKITLNLKLFDDNRRFIAYKNKVAPRMGTAGGFYISRIKEASVYTGRSNKRMYAVTRHEAVHAIVDGAFGRIPTWLNEGLAEYFERLSFEGGTSRIVKPSKKYLALLSRKQLPHLANYFGLSNEQWYSESRKNKHYALGWSLVYFLMSTEHDKKFLRFMLDNLAYNYCQPFSDIEYINKHYQGGLQKFEQNWKKWLASKKREHRY